MAHVIAWIFEALLRLFLPSSGRHRAAGATDGRPAVQRQNTPTVPTARVPDARTWRTAAECVTDSTTEAHRISGPSDGYGTAMVRPYFVACEQQCNSRPRLKLLCAPRGVAVIR
ncbi:hypothetical protein [Streptomyces sparsogenes]|uniref:Uncharacterized protein n=1 Tax=Streptomyces sparsogenes DSM 40356 TaxID=1331668 RepID=A0A1R1SNL9_9ACTN|nr:hypothetical protein [Streptomyces sparsogenes]OMI39896.1 hypothetical protein SPAR_08661 [Streptomyces sparsogenes DSM 40356]